ncbi:MAG: SdpI family protein [Oscillospiraceae bacterium]
MKNRLLWTLSLLPALITACFMPFMANSVPMHYNAAGEIDRWGSKYENFIFPALILLLSLFWALLIRYFNCRAAAAPDDKARAEAESNGKVLNIVALSMAGGFTVMQCALLYAALQSAEPVGGDILTTVSNIIVGGLLIILGNFLPKARKNSLVGVRTVWSMKNDKTWAVSNRFGGIVFVAAGAVIILGSAFLTGTLSTVFLLAVVLIAAGLSVWYSYRAYMKFG